MNAKKQFLIRIGALLTLFPLLSFALLGCKDKGISTENGISAERDALAARIVELEATLQAEREENYINQSALQNKIKDLEAQIAGQSGREEHTDSGNAMVFHYTIADGKATVTKYEGSATLVEIPAMLDGYPVTTIGDRAFEGNTHLAAVVIPQGVTAICWFAFYGCSSLFEVNIPASVCEIGYAVFDGCAKPTITCPAGSYAAEYAKSYGMTCTEK